MTWNSSSARPRRTYWKASLAVAFFVLAAGILSARATTATNYEVSIYTATAPTFWMGVVVAVGVCLAASLYTDGTVRWVGLGLGGLAVASFVALPVVRGYQYFGEPDSLSHLGWTTELVRGELHPSELFYPGIHSISSLVHAITGFSVPRSMMITVTVFALAFVLFAVLCVRLFANTELAVVAAVFSAFFFLPINHVTAELVPQPIVQATLFTTIILYLFIRHVAGADTSSLLNEWGALFALSLAAIVLFHPQQALVLVIFFGAISAAQFYYRRFRTNHPASTHRSVLPYTIFLFTLFGTWSVRHDWFFNNIDAVYVSVQGFLTGTSSSDVVTQRGGSLTAIGASIAEIFVKLFLVDAAYLVLGGTLLVAAAYGATRFDPGTNTLLTYQTWGLAALAPFIGLHYIVDSLSRLSFRYVATVMVLFTVLGALQAYQLSSFNFARLRPVKHAVTVGVAIFLVVSVATVFPSPWIYLPSTHVTDAQLQGYESTFDDADETIEITAIRLPPWRYYHAIHGASDWPILGSTVSEEAFATDLRDGSNQQRYITVTEFDRERETAAYKELRYSDADFNRLTTQRGVHRVKSNGGLELYLVT